MKDKKIVTIVLAIVSIVYTLLVKFVDVQAIGPEGSSVGFATINRFFASIFTYNDSLYKLTKILGYLAILVALAYAVVGIKQLIERKDIKKVDKELLALAAFDVLVLIIYIFFEKVIINYRPIILEEGLEASYPSSHTLLAIFVCGSSYLINNKLYKKYGFKKYANPLVLVLLILIVIGRMVSGVHWVSDILGGILIGTTLVSAYDYTINNYLKK